VLLLYTVQLVGQVRLVSTVRQFVVVDLTLSVIQQPASVTADQALLDQIAHNVSALYRVT